MTKNLILLLTALAVTAGFSGCERDPYQAELGASGKKVNAQLVLSVATGTAQTKQTASEVQVAAGTFRGLDDATLLTYTQANDGRILAAAAEASEAPSLLHRLFSSEATRRIVTVKLPEGTNTLVFYGRSPVSSEPDKYGKLKTYEVKQKVGESCFELGARLTDATAFDNTTEALAGMLTAVMGTSLDGAAFTLDGISVTSDDYNKSPNQICKAWADYGAITNGQSIVEPGAVWYVWEEKLANLYNQMTGISYNKGTGFPNDVELRAGSGKAILDMAKGIWKVIYPITKATATSKAEAVAKKLAMEINTKLDGYFSYSKTGEEPDWTKPLTFKGTNDYANFPTNFNLMPGIAYMTFDATNKKFVYPQDWTGIGGPGLKATDIYYPAQLLYFGNSPVQTSEDEYSASDYPATASAWSSKDWTGKWPTTHVTASSRSVAMVKNIRYGVAMLETKVGYTTEVNGLIKTNNPDLPEQTMAVQDTREDPDTHEILPATFQLTGIVIGGQSTKVGWDFLPVSGQGYIYDKLSEAISIPADNTKTSTVNYTVVFDNYNAAAPSANKPQDKVYVALELQNNGDDFYGRNNWVHKGDRFYLVGELNPEGKTWPTTETNGSIIPPYDANGESTKEPRIFIQDYKTTVTFKIGPNSLKYAYITVPDLRSTSMTLGLSVDIDWKQGIDYGTVIVGGTE